MPTTTAIACLFLAGWLFLRCTSMTMFLTCALARYHHFGYWNASMAGGRELQGTLGWLSDLGYMCFWEASEASGDSCLVKASPPCWQPSFEHRAHKIGSDLVTELMPFARAATSPPPIPHPQVCAQGGWAHPSPHLWTHLLTDYD